LTIIDALYFVAVGWRKETMDGRKETEKVRNGEEGGRKPGERLWAGYN
jgi:hypothetical protein